MAKDRKKLLILTQSVDNNNPILGFFINWLNEFAKHFEFVTVICLEKGEFSLPENVKVLSLGKEKGQSRLKYLFNFYKYIWQERKNYDSVFVHMNPIYVILGGLFWKGWRKKIGLWYVHKEVELKLRFSEKLVDYIFTASKESNGLKSKKVKILSHGININQFAQEERSSDGFFNIIYVGRISPIKNQLLLVQALEKIVEKKEAQKIKIKFIGGPISEKDSLFEREIKVFVEEKNLGSLVEFLGFVTNDKIANFYHDADLSINLCPTGGLDKTVLESILCGVPAIVLNKTFVNEFEEYSGDLIINNDDPEELAEKIIILKRIEGERLEKMREDLKGKIR